MCTGGTGAGDGGGADATMTGASAGTDIGDGTCGAVDVAMRGGAAACGWRGRASFVAGTRSACGGTATAAGGAATGTGAGSAGCSGGVCFEHATTRREAKEKNRTKSR